jgi:ubiquitin-protein ligase E3 C
MFDENELYYIICGSENSIDINDWKSNCTYAGGYDANHPTIKLFWQALSQFSSSQKKALLKFITSSPRVSKLLKD